MTRNEIIAVLEKMMLLQGVYGRMIQGWKDAGIFEEVLDDLVEIGFENELDLIMYF